MNDSILIHGLPANVDAERVLLGSILLDGLQFDLISGTVTADDFSLEKHRRIFTRMADMHSRGEQIDRITLANELTKRNELEPCDGLIYLISLDTGLPQIPNLDGYVRIVQEKATLRKMIRAGQALIDRCINAVDG